MKSVNRALLIVAVLAGAACEKVPFTDVNAGFTLADATWFEQEQTLFVFYRVDAEQGLGPNSQIEVTWRTDDLVVPWTPIADLSPVHTHLPVDCGSLALCGSTSLRVEKTPREVGVRLRYHRDGGLTLAAPLTFNVIGAGPAFSNRSLVLYGVFDETNTHVQWRARHLFPTLRNQQVQELGLRRTFWVEQPQFGAVVRAPDPNAYGYGFAPACPGGLTPLGWERVETTARAIFDPHSLPLSASDSPMVCAASTVTDATGTFQTAVLARKNPETHPAFPALRSPIRNNLVVGFLLRICNHVISEPHQAMQVQRLLLDGAPQVCLDDWEDSGFVARLAATFRARIDLERLQGRDMVLAVALHHDEATGALADKLEQALELVLPFERDKSSPRVSGAFVFDSYGHATVRADLQRLVLWCPAKLTDDLDQLSSTSVRSCPLLPDSPDLTLGPFRFSNIPIFPTRAQYLTFLAKYSEAQGGKMHELTFLAPERTPISQNVPLGTFGVATFFNNEVLTAQPGDVFSFCQSGDPGASSVVFRVPGLPDPLPLSSLGPVHQTFPQPAYALGLFWDFPFLLRLKYDLPIGGSVTVFGFTVPFGIAASTTGYFGAQQWETEEVSLAKVLLQCTRFCDQPTFDSAGVYNVGALFRDTYGTVCYRPLYPKLGDGGFPLDP